MNMDSADRVLDDWLSEGPTQGPRQGLHRALSATRAVQQRHGWSFPSWWLPRPVADSSPRVRRYAVLALTILLLLLALFAFAVGVGRQPPNIRNLLGPAANQLVAFSDGAAIGVSRLDGTARRTLSGSVVGAHSPVFSPDGKLVAFEAPAPAGSGDRLFVVPVNGSTEPVEINTVFDGLNVDVLSTTVPQFSWSPDSARIAFAGMGTSSDDDGKIYVAAIYGAVYPVTDGLVSRDLPTWSPDGQWIALRWTEPDGLQRSVDVASEDGTRFVTVASANAPDSTISKARWITGHESDSGPSQLLSYTLNAGSESTTRAVIGMGTPNTGYVDQLYPWDAGIGGYPELGLPWSPDGNSIAILTESDGLVVVGIKHSASSTSKVGAIQRLGHVADCWVDWLPDGSGLYGGSPNGCTGTVVIPLSSPDASVTVPGATGIASWQPLEQ